MYDRIFRPDVLWRAWTEVKQNGGCAGIDKVTIKDVEEMGSIQYLAEIRDELINSTYRPQPVLRVYIPKADGKQRPLGIPTVKDRIVQQACKIIIEPIFEANFQDCSYGFRPKYNAQEAVLAVKDALMFNWYVFDADIQSYFDNIDHEILMALLQRRISDRRVLKLISKWLKVGVVENGKILKTEKGTPQGGVISPLLANIYLHVLDTYWVNKGAEIGQLFRYADDFVIICKTYHNAVKAHDMIKTILNRLKLNLHPSKTRVLYTRKEGFDFLGFHFHKLNSRTNGKLYPYVWPGQKAMREMRQTIHQKTTRATMRKKLIEIIDELNPIIRGWRNYFNIGNPTRKLIGLEVYLKRRLCGWVLKHHKEPRKLDKIKFGKWYANCGMEKFCPKRKCG